MVRGSRNLLIRRSAGLICCVAAMAWAAMTLPGCNTTEGVGEDIEAAGSELEEAAEEAG